MQGIAQGDMDLGIAGLDRDGLAADRDRLAGRALGLQRPRQIGMGGGQRRPDRDRPPEGVDRAIEIAQRPPHDAHVVERLGMPGL